MNATKDKELLLRKDLDLISDVVELDIDDRVKDQERDLEREALLLDALLRLRAGEQLLDEQIGPVADAIELNIDEREVDLEEDPEAVETLTRSLRRLRAG